MGEHAVLRGDAVAFAYGVDEAQEFGGARDAVACGVDADDGVAGAEREAVNDGGGDTDGVVGGVVRLQARGEAAAETDACASA